MFLGMQDFDFFPNLIKFCQIYPNFTFKFAQTFPKFAYKKLLGDAAASPAPTPLVSGVV